MRHHKVLTYVGNMRQVGAADDFSDVFPATAGAVLSDGEGAAGAHRIATAGAVCPTAGAPPVRTVFDGEGAVVTHRIATAGVVCPTAEAPSLRTVFDGGGAVVTHRIATAGAVCPATGRRRPDVVQSS